MIKEQKHNVHAYIYFTIITSGIAIILSLVTIFRYDYRTDLEIDYLGGMVAIISLAVTVFVTVQIYQSFNLKKDIDEQNKKLLKDMETTNKHQIETLVNENEKLRSQFQEIKKELEWLKSDITFTRILNYATKMHDGNLIQYAIDGYMDALLVAVKDNLTKDRIEVIINLLSKIRIDYQDYLKTKCPLLPNKKEWYYDILSQINPQNEKTRALGIFILQNVKETDITFPQEHIRITSDYNPDNKTNQP